MSDISKMTGGGSAEQRASEGEQLREPRYLCRSSAQHAAQGFACLPTCDQDGEGEQNPASMRVTQLGRIRCRVDVCLQVTCQWAKGQLQLNNSS
jgi:hypothetical protein